MGVGVGAGAGAGAGAGTDYRQFPWGNLTCEEAPAGTCPDPDNSTSPRSPDPVGAHPLGASALGLLDLVGNVWQLTDSYCDGLTCAVVLRGGSLYRPLLTNNTGMLWPPSAGYVPQALSLTQHLRAPYADDSGQRSAYVGFRCALDSVQGAAGDDDGARTRWGAFVQPASAR